MRLTTVVVLVFLAACSGTRTGTATGTHETPRREDRGDLIVLHLYGSYYDMGRQQAELLGPVARAMYDYHHDKYAREIERAPFSARLLDSGMGLMPALGPLYEDSGFFDEMNGIADGLGVPRADLLRAIIATAFGSTVFAATRSATADGNALIGRNVDWDDGGGIMRPVVMHFHPNNGDLDYIIGGWPLIGAPAIGINAAGLALSFNFFLTEEIFGPPPEMRDRRALQTARTVEEGLRVFTEVRKRAMPTFMVMADAGGDVAMIECTPSRYAIFRPDGDWFGQANHARTLAMIPYDRYQSPDSFRRRAAMEAAVRPHLGRLTPEIASRIIRDRSNSRYVNDNTVANPAVLNAAVIQPAARTLWHSTTMQPLAPFGEMVPFTIGGAAADKPVLPADPRLGSAEMEREKAVMEEARWAVRAYKKGDLTGARLVWDRQAERREPLLDPDRLAWARAAVRFRQGELRAVEAVLAEIDAERAPFEIGAAGLALNAVVADRQGRRAEAVVRYRTALALLDTHPEFTDFYTSATRAVIEAGIEAPNTEDLRLMLPDLQRVPE